MHGLAFILRLERCHHHRQRAIVCVINLPMNKTKQDPNYKVIAESRRARFDYAIEDDLECGVLLLGSEVKSLRVNGANIAESYASVEKGEL